MGKKASLEILKKCLIKEKLRLTDQRIAIWNQIRNSKKHMDVEEIFSLLKTKRKIVSRATIYRTLDVLVKTD